jgi:hypothetical protein
MLDGRDWDAREHEQIAQRQRAFQTGVFLCMMLLMMDVRDPRAVQEEALRRARAEAEEAALRRQAAPTWLDHEIVGEGSTQNVTGLYRGGWVYNTHNTSTGPGGHEGRAALQMDMFRVASIEKVSVVRAMVQLAAPPGAGRSGDVLASAFGVYFHGSRRVALLGNVGEPSDDGVDLRKRANATHDDDDEAEEEDRPFLRRNRTHRLHPRQRRHYDAQTGRRLIARLANKHPFVRAHLASNSGSAAALSKTLTDVSQRRLGEKQRTRLSSRALPDALFDGGSYDLVVARLLGKKEDKDRPMDAAVTSTVVEDTEERAKLRVDPSKTLKGYGQTLWKNGECALEIDLVASDDKKTRKSAPSKNAPYVTELIGSVRAPSCGFSLTVNASATRVDWRAAEDQASWYSSLMTFVCVWQIYALFKQLHFCRTQAVALRVSLVSLGMQALWDAVLCVANLLLCAAVPQLFSTFTTVAFLELIVFCVIEMRYLLLVWQAHDPQRNWDAAGWVQLRRELATVHAHFYVALAVVLLVLYASRDEPSLILLAASSYWVPQIIRNVKTNAREPVCDHYLYGMSVSRLLLPAYLLLVQDALPRVLMVPSPSAITPSQRLKVFLSLVVWQAIQVALLKLQRLKGARCFVPDYLVPKPYDYQRDPAHILRAAGADGPECAICMGPVNAVTGEFMVTPCDHMFHEICLRQWMDLKMECPVCRAALPPTPNDDEEGVGDSPMAEP